MTWLKAAEKKKKGPGRGWWGPPRGSHGAREHVDASGKALPASKSERDARAWRAYDPDGTATVYAETDSQLRAIARDVGKKTGIQPDTVGDLLETWSASSNEEYAILHTQRAASRLFGVETSPWQNEEWAVVSRKRENAPNHPAFKSVFEQSDDLGKYKSHDAAADAVVREMYQSTQAWFGEHGYKPGETVRLYRGQTANAAERDGRTEVGGTKEFRSNALESWSLDPDTARRFAKHSLTDEPEAQGQMVAAEFPIERILSSARTGLGSLGEYELVVIGGSEPDTYRVIFDGKSGDEWDG